MLNISRKSADRSSRAKRSRAVAAMIESLESRQMLTAAPFGKVETFSAALIKGYVSDKDVPDAAVTVQVLVDGAVVASGPANIDRSDVHNFPSATTTHGFSFPLTLSPGAHTVVVQATDDTSATPKVLRSGRVTNRPPTAKLSTATNLQVVGFATDPDDTSAGLTITVNVNGVLNTTVTADQARPAGARGGGLGNHWFIANLTGVPDGPAHIEVFATDISSGTTVKVADKTTPNQKPVGALQVVNAGLISGFARDPDSSAAVDVFIQLDRGTPVPVANSAEDNATSPGHGFHLNTPTHFAGTHTVKLIAKDTFSGVQTVIATKTFTNRAPKGVVESIVVSGGSFTITGYAFDQDDPTGSRQIVVRVDFNPRVQDSGVTKGPFLANVARPDLVAKRKIVNPEHGFIITPVNLGIALAPGKHKVEVFVADSATGITTLIGTKTVTTV